MCTPLSKYFFFDCRGSIMEKYLHRPTRKAIPLSADFFRLLLQHCAWPEIFALTRVCKTSRKVALPQLKMMLPQLKAEFLDLCEIKNCFCPRRSDEKIGFRWNFGNWYWDSWTAKHPREYDILQLMCYIFRDLLHCHDSKRFYEIEHFYSQEYARFCRISGWNKQGALKSWRL